MTVHRIENCNGTCHSGLGDGIKSSLIGGAAGYIAKYALPLTEQEKDSDYKKIIENIKSQAEKSENEFLESIKANPQRSLAQDAYVKSSENFIQHNRRLYNLYVKSIRPATPFIIAGAITGLVYSFVKNTFSV